MKCFSNYTTLQNLSFLEFQSNKYPFLRETSTRNSKKKNKLKLLLPEVDVLGTEYSPDPINRVLVILSAIAVIIGIFFVLYCVTQVFLMSFGYKDSQSMVDTVVSPFDSIVKEYSPKSSKPCSYPTLNYPYDTTSPCNCKFKQLKIIETINELISSFFL